MENSARKGCKRTSFYMQRFNGRSIIWSLLIFNWVGLLSLGLNMQANPSLVRLDRFLVDDGWPECFNQSLQRAASNSVYNHLPIILDPALHLGVLLFSLTLFGLRKMVLKS